MRTSRNWLGQTAGMAVVTSDIAECVRDLPKGNLLLAEAAYGEATIKPYLDALSPGASVLEIGSGPGILLTLFTQSHPSLHFTGIEPIGSGFSTSEPFVKRLTARFAIDLRRCGYEDFQGAEGFDLIFLINVFEHLTDWRDFLGFVERTLKPGGRCIILCPNYGFPYESHFGVPVVGGKALTRWLFRKRIDHHERHRNAHGLWQSLNFVKWHQVQASLSGRNLSAKFDPTILSRMINRLQTDPEFLRRQSRVAGAARLLTKSGLLRLLQSKVFWRWYPYMQITLTRTI